MKFTVSTIILALTFTIGCASSVSDNTVLPDPTDQPASSPDPSLSHGSWACWGLYDLEIASDGSYAHVIPDRMATARERWGWDLNAVKLLEDGPCHDCLSTSNVHRLPNGDISIDVTLTHPWPEIPVENLYCTGFDVRGIVMFPASQYFPDNDLRIRAGKEPWHEGDGSFIHRYSTHLKGDPELMNPDGWLSIWNADDWWYDFRPLGEGLPIFEYYPGRFSSGEELGTINGYKRYYTNENRHIFEVGKSATRTYIIRPPSQGVIHAAYAVYAHWALPTVTPVTDPAVDFPPEANSLLPYECWVTQERPLDPDPPLGSWENALYNGPFVHFHIKTWQEIGKYSMGYNEWDVPYLVAMTGAWHEDPENPDEYYFGKQGEPVFDSRGYIDLNEQEPDTFPGSWPYIVRWQIYPPREGVGGDVEATEYFIFNIEYEENDGEW